MKSLSKQSCCHPCPKCVSTVWLKRTKVSKRVATVQDVAGESELAQAARAEKPKAAAHDGSHQDTPGEEQHNRGSEDGM